MDGYPFVSGYLRGVAGTIFTSTVNGTRIVGKSEKKISCQNESMLCSCYLLYDLKNGQNFGHTIRVVFTCIQKTNHTNDRHHTNENLKR